MKKLLILIFILFISVIYCQAIDAPTELKTEGKDDAHRPGIDNIAGVEEPAPHFNWKPDTTTTQVRYQLILDDNDGNIWNTGEVMSSSTECCYGGSEILLSNNTYFWKVKTWETGLSSSAYSSFYDFRMNHFIKRQDIETYQKKQMAFAVGDINGDGLRDYVQADYDGNMVRAYINTSTGTFKTGWQSPAENNSQAIALADIDNDGYLDLIVLNKSGDTRIYKNNGNGNFTEFDYFSSPTVCESIAVGDIDRDGDLDFIEGNNGSDNVYYKNDGNGNFTTSEITTDLNDNTRDILLADLNGDSYLDLIVGNWSDNNRVYLNTKISTGPYKDTVDWESTETEKTTALTLIDINGNGDWDFIAGNRDEKDRYYINNGNGSFPTNDITSESDGTYTLSAGDIDNDGDMDYVEGNYSTNDRIYVNSEGNFSLGCNSFFDSNVSPYYKTYKLNLNDFTGDGAMDILRGIYDCSPDPTIDNFLVHYSSISNTGPAASSSGLSANYETLKLKLEWNPPTDDHTPENQLSYNIRLGTSPGNYNVISGAIGSSDNSGSFWGNIGRSTYVYLNIEPKAYFWQVQAIDTSKSTGAWCIEQSINESPICGWNDNNILVSTCAGQWTFAEIISTATGKVVVVEERRGLVDIYFKIKDSERLDSILTGFEYSTSTIDAWHPLPNDSIYLTLSTYNVTEKNLWPDNQEDMFKTASITSTWSNAAPYHFTWDSNDMPELQNIQCDETRIRFKAYDIFGATSVNFVQSELFSIDNLNPAQPGELKCSLIYGSTYYTVLYGAPSADNNFLEYKIFIGTDNPSVDLTSYDSIWDKDDDANLSSVTFGGASSSTITGLLEDTTYYLKLYAFDNYGNYSSTTTYSIKTNDPPNMEVVKITAAQRTDGSDLVDITFYGIDNDIEVSSYVPIQCFYKISGLDYEMTPSTTDSNFSNEPLEFKKTQSSYTFVWNAGENVPNISSDTFQVKIDVTDGRACGSTGWTDNFTVDTLPPDCTGFWVKDASCDSIAWQWYKTNDEHFLKYELWYSSKSPDYAILRDTNNADYVTLYNNVNSTTTSGLQETTDYWGCLWIYDFYGHESHTSTATSKTGYLPNTIFSLQPDPLKDGSGNILVKVDVSDKDGDTCKIKVEYILGGSTCAATIDVTTSTYGSAYENNSSTYQIRDIVTYDTNTVTFNWCSKTDKDNIYNENVYLKITANDGILDGNTKISSPFKIDNSQPEYINIDVTTIAKYNHEYSSFTIFFIGEAGEDEVLNPAQTNTSRFQVHDDKDSPSDFRDLSGSTVTSSTNCLYIKINDEKRNKIARWDGEGKIPYLTILSSAARDNYGNYSIEKSSVVFNTSQVATKIYWVPDTTDPVVSTAIYAISAGKVNLEIGFDEYIDILSITTATISGIKIQDRESSPSHVEELDSSCDILTPKDDSKTLLINIPGEKHNKIWGWNSDIYLTISSTGTITDPSGNGITIIPDNAALHIGTFISTETPKVIQNSPTGYNISRDSIITVKFNAPLKTCEPDVINSIYVRQIKNSENKDVNYTISCGSITYNEENKLLTFTPQEELPGNSVIKVLIDRDYIENFGGVKMKENFVWNFKTALKNDDDNLFISPSGNFTVFVSKNMLPFNGRVEFTEEIPPNTPMQTQIAAVLRANTAENSWKNPYHYQFEDLTAEIVFYSTNGVFNTLNFEENAELTIDYSDCLLNENPGYLRYGNNPPVKENTIKIYYLNEQLNNWIPVNTRLNEEKNKISAFIRHFSVYTIMGAQNHDIEDAHPYPVPYKPTARVEDGGIPSEFAGTLRSGITFTDMPSECDIEIYTIAGRLVQTIHHSDADLQINGYVGNRYWYPVQNLYDEDVVSGVYIYYIEGENKHKMGKLMIIR